MTDPSRLKLGGRGVSPTALRLYVGHLALHPGCSQADMARATDRSRHAVQRWLGRHRSLWESLSPDSYGVSRRLRLTADGLALAIELHNEKDMHNRSTMARESA